MTDREKMVRILLQWHRIEHGPPAHFRRRGETLVRGAIMDIRAIDQIEIEGKRVFVRVDFNVPLDDAGEIIDDTRIRSAVPTLTHAIERGAKLIIGSHLGRPKGQRVERYSMAPCAKRLEQILGRPVRLAPDCAGSQVEALIRQMNPGDVLMLENLRFDPGETDNDPGFGRALARLADVYINDGFAVAHRANASVVAITRRVETCGAGFLMKRELDAFARIMEHPARPLVGILGGGKVSDKLGVVSRLIDLCDKILLGGGLAYTFLRSQGIETGGSLVEEEMLPMAGRILRKARRKKTRLYLPVDCVVAREKSADASTLKLPVQEIPPDRMALDIGPASVTLFAEAIADARTIVWNGPMGVYELAPFSEGTARLVQEVAASDAFTLIGGGDLTAAVHQAGLADRISYISTGGGAFLELLEGKTLPGIRALRTCSGRKKRGARG